MYLFFRLSFQSDIPILLIRPWAHPRPYKAWKTLFHVTAPRHVLNVRRSGLIIPVSPACAVSFAINRHHHRLLRVTDHHVPSWGTRRQSGRSGSRRFQRGTRGEADWGRDSQIPADREVISDRQAVSPICLGGRCCGRPSLGASQSCSVSPSRISALVMHVVFCHLWAFRCR